MKKKKVTVLDVVIGLIVLGIIILIIKYFHEIITLIGNIFLISIGIAFVVFMFKELTGEANNNDKK